MGAEGPTRAACRQEIERLHAFFVDWYTGRLDPVAFDRFETALGPGFEMVTPEGECMKRAPVVEMVHEKGDTHRPGTFDIEIQNVTPVAIETDHALVRYEEHQRTPDGRTARLSTVYFESDDDAPEGLVWRHVHETWLAPEGAD